MAPLTMRTAPAPMALAGATPSLNSSKNRVVQKFRVSARKSVSGRARIVSTRALSGETLGAIAAGAAGIACGLGIPIFFASMEARDKKRVEEIRDTNRANLKATGQTLSE